MAVDSFEIVLYVEIFDILSHNNLSLAAPGPGILEGAQYEPVWCILEPQFENGH